MTVDIAAALISLVGTVIVGVCAYVHGRLTTLEDRIDRLEGK